MILHSLPRWM